MYNVVQLQTYGILPALFLLPDRMNTHLHDVVVTLLMSYQGRFQFWNYWVRWRGHSRIRTRFRETETAWHSFMALKALARLWILPPGNTCWSDEDYTYRDTDLQPEPLFTLGI